ncbi:MAG: recombinase family protein [Desulfobacterales bacterium]|nr:recombinase family protein [Desulfobacterales bacterium]
MSDFLRNLRSSHKKETPPPRKPIKPMEGNYYPQTERRMLSDRRTPPMQRQPSQAMDDLARELGDMLPVIMDNTTNLVKQVEKLATINEMVMESQIRQHNALADFFENIGDLLAKSSPSEMPPRATASYASGTHYTKDDILSIINNMRDQGATFAIIADYLKEKGIPTFSGRGEWHAQTIHRLCK